MNEVVQSVADQELLTLYGYGPIRLSGRNDALHERHLLFDDVVAPEAAGPRERFEAAARSVRDVRLTALYADSDAWARKAILNVAGSGKFISDHTIAQYAAEIWRAKPCPVP